MEYQELQKELQNLLQNASKYKVFDFLDKQISNKNITNSEYTKMIMFTRDYYRKQQLIENILGY